MERLTAVSYTHLATTPAYGQAWQYKVEGSNDKSSWDMLWDNTANTDFSKEQYGKIAAEYANNKYQYVRVTLTQLPDVYKRQVSYFLITPRPIG